DKYWRAYGCWSRINRGQKLTIQRSGVWRPCRVTSCSANRRGVYVRASLRRPQGVNGESAPIAVGTLHLLTASHGIELRRELTLVSYGLSFGSTDVSGKQLDQFCHVLQSRLESGPWLLTGLLPLPLPLGDAGFDYRHVL